MRKKQAAATARDLAVAEARRAELDPASNEWRAANAQVEDLAAQLGAAGPGASDDEGPARLEVSSMVWTSGIWTVHPGHEDEFIAGWAAFARWSASAYGGGRAWLLRDRERPQVFMSLGPWPSDHVIASWRSSPGFLERIGGLRALLVSFEPRTLDEVVEVS